MKGSRQGCYVVVGHGPPRTWGKVHLALWGNGWLKKDIDLFSKSFWDFSERTVAELVGAKKVQSRTVEN